MTLRTALSGTAAGIACAAGALLAACSSDSTGGRVCTDLFAYISVITVDSAGHPLDAPLAVRDSVPRNGVAFDEAQQPFPGVDAITIFSDADQHKVSNTHTEPVTVRGTGTAGSFTADYVFDATGCHVEKVSGPDTVVVAR